MFVKKISLTLLFCLLVASLSYASDSVVYVTKSGSKYHRESCSSLKKSKIKTIKSKAIAGGYVACKKCSP